MDRRGRFLLAVCLIVVAGVSVPERALAQGAAGAGDGFFGVALSDVPPEQAANYGIRGPAVVAAGVIPNGPAYNAGLREGDVITSVDGHTVSDSRTAADLLRAHRAGDKARIGLVHLMPDGRRVAIEIGVVAEPRPAAYGGMPPLPPAPGAMPPLPPPEAMPPAPPDPRSAAPHAGGLHVVDQQTAMPGTPQRQGNCSAMLPPGWGFVSVGQYGDTADVAGAGGRAHAAWGIRGVNTAMRAYYGDMFGPPEAATLATASAVVQAPARYAGAPATVAGYFIARPFEAGNVIGTTLSHAYDGPAPGQYVLSSFIAWVDRGAVSLLPTAQAVMASIHCQTQLRPVEMSTPTARPTSRRSSESDALKDYNAQLGTQWAHSSTGRSYLLDRATQWNDNGPDGPGYYIKSGNSYEKLTPGL